MNLGSHIITQPSDAINPCLIIVCGLPGAGKTTHGRHLEQAGNAIRLSPDEWMNALDVNLHNEHFRERVEQLQWTLARQLLARSLTVIVEWGTWSRQERDRLRIEARALGAVVELHYLAAPPDVLFERIRQRAAEDPPIEAEAVLRWIAIFEPPDRAEISLFDRFLLLNTDVHTEQSIESQGLR